MRRELEILIVLFHQQCIVLYLVLLIRTGVSEGLRTDYQMIYHLYLTVGEKHMIESCITLEIASNLVCYIVLGRMCSNYLFYYVFGVVELHQLWDVDYLVVAELQN